MKTAKSCREFARTSIKTYLAAVRHALLTARNEADRQLAAFQAPGATRRDPRSSQT